MIRKRLAYLHRTDSWLSTTSVILVPGGTGGNECRSRGQARLDRCEGTRDMDWARMGAVYNLGLRRAGVIFGHVHL